MKAELKSRYLYFRVQRSCLIVAFHPSSLLFYSPQLAPTFFLMTEGCLCPSSLAWIVVS
jgi:hypothetical protein